MPNPNASATDTNWLQGDIPGGDIPFGDLFGPEPEASLGSNATKAEPQTTASPEPATTATESTRPAETSNLFEIQTATGSVYKSVDAAKKGIEEKDTLIQNLRDKIVALTGTDPLSRRQAPQPQEQASYLQDPSRFAKDLANAAEKNDSNAYAQTHFKLLEEYLGPARPLIQEFAQRKAEEQVSSEIKDFLPFRRSGEFQKVLDSRPTLAQAIKGAEGDLRYASQLPELYSLAYAEYTRQRLPELLKANAAPQVAVNTPTTQARATTSQASTMTPASPVDISSQQELLRTREGRQQLKQMFESQGIDKFVW